MRTVLEHQAAALGLVGPLPRVAVPLADAAGQVLADDLIAVGPIPPWDNSAMDGYAVRVADLARADDAHPTTLAVAGDLPAGSAATPEVRPGTAVRIMTGAPVPPGADAVVPVELTDGGVDVVRVRSAPDPGAHIRRVGEDVRAGDVVLRAGTLLGARQIGAAAAVGAAAVVVHRRPLVAVLSTGSELVRPGAPAARGQIPDSNSYLLAAAVEGAGCGVVRLDAVPDDPSSLRACLAALDGSFDAVVTSGGVSVGAYDVVKEVLGGWGEVEFVSVAMQPGKPQGLGRLPTGTPVFCLPGNPVSVFVSFEVFVRPALRRMRGLAEVGRPLVRAVVTDGWRTPIDRAQYMPVVLEEVDSGWRARRAVRGGSGSHLVTGLARSDGLAVVPADVDEIRPGDTVNVLRSDG